MKDIIMYMASCKKYKNVYILLSITVDGNKKIKTNTYFVVLRGFKRYKKSKDKIQVKWMEIL